MERLDLISQEVHLTVNRGKDRYQTLFGGIITVIALGAIIGISVYFLYDFIAKSQMNLSSTKVLSEETVIPLQNVPIMVRLTASDSSPYEKPQRLYKIWFQVWFLSPDPNKEDALMQDHVEIEMEQCDMTQHFGDYKTLFQQYNDIGTFFCPKRKANNYTLFGMYGSAKPFTCYHIQISYCINTTDNDSCAPKEEINSQLALTYIEMRTVDYLIANNETLPNKGYVKGTRSPLSVNTHKRTWVYYDMIDYYTDYGFMMESNTKLQFFQINSLSSEIDFRDISVEVDGVVGSFASVTFSSLNYIQAYYRSYEKIQSLIANVGGIMKAAMTFAYILNYFPSNRCSMLYLATATPPNSQHQSTKVNQGTKNSFNTSSNHPMNPQTPATINNYLVSPKKKLSSSKVTQIQQEPLIPKKTKVPFTFYFMPFACVKKTKFISTYLKGCERLKDLLDITTLIHLVSRCDNMQESIRKVASKDNTPKTNSLLQRNKGNFQTNFTSASQNA